MEKLAIKIDDLHSFEFGHLKDASFWAKQSVVNERYPELNDHPMFPNDYYEYSHFEIIPYYQSNLMKFTGSETLSTDTILDRIAIKFYVKGECVTERTSTVDWMKGFKYNEIYRIEEILYRDLKL